MRGLRSVSPSTLLALTAARHRLCSYSPARVAHREGAEQVAVRLTAQHDAGDRFFHAGARRLRGAARIGSRQSLGCPPPRDKCRCPRCSGSPLHWRKPPAPAACAMRGADHGRGVFRTLAPAPRPRAAMRDGSASNAAIAQPMGSMIRRCSRGPPRPGGRQASGGVRTPAMLFAVLALIHGGAERLALPADRTRPAAHALHRLAPCAQTRKLTLAALAAHRSA